MTLSCRRAHALAVVFAVSSIAGCDPDRGSVRDWVAADHDLGAKPQNMGGQQRPAQQNQNRPAKDVAMANAITVYQSVCQNCHGSGAGNGPAARNLKLPDFTSPEWQASVTDDQIAKTIKEGKGSMPPNPDIPDTVVASLVRGIRMFGSPAMRGGGQPDAPHGRVPAGHPNVSTPKGAPDQGGDDLPPGHPNVAPDSGDDSLPPGHPR
ncbi:MAG: cytochrome c [Polyangiaceae bacterium]